MPCCLLTTCARWFSPKGSKVSDLQFDVLDKILETGSISKNMLSAAYEFWNSVARDDLSSDELKAFTAIATPATRIAKPL